MDNLLQFIGLMRRAGALVAGAEASFDACRTGRARLLVTAADSSPNTVYAARETAGDCEVPYISLPYGKAAVGEAIGTRDCAVLTVCDTGFAIALCEKTGRTEPLDVLERRLRREKKKSRNTSAKRGTKR